jgi:hypothetical protein
MQTIGTALHCHGRGAAVWMMRNVDLDLIRPSRSMSEITAKVGTEGVTKIFLFWNIFGEL